MSIENAILELAGAIRSHGESLAKMAEANHALAANDTLKLEAYERSLQVYVASATGTATTEAEKHEVAGAPDEELEQAVQKVEAAAKAEKAAPAKKNAQAEPSPAEPAAPTTSSQAALSDDTTLDYKTDVKPVLLKVFKAHGQPALKGLLDKFGVPNGDKLSADQLPAVLAEANALLAG